MPGTSSWVKIGTSRNATATRVAERPSSRAVSFRGVKMPRASTQVVLSAHHAGEAAEHAVAELIETTAEQRRGDENGDHDREELRRVLHRLFLQLRGGLNEGDQDADDGGND